MYDPFSVVARKASPSYLIRTFNYRELRVILYKMNVWSDLEPWKQERDLGLLFDLV